MKQAQVQSNKAERFLVGSGLCGVQDYAELVWAGLLDWAVEALSRWAKENATPHNIVQTARFGPLHLGHKEGLTCWSTTIDAPSGKRRGRGIFSRRFWRRQPIVTENGADWYKYAQPASIYGRLR